MGLGISPVGIRGEGGTLVGRTSVLGGSEKVSNTTKMGDVMLKRGVNTSATIALLEEVGHQNGLIDLSTGTIGFTDENSKNVTVQPIL